MIDFGMKIDSPPPQKKVFRKYSHSLGPDALEAVESILDECDITNDEVEHTVEALAIEYNKQDGA